MNLLRKSMTRLPKASQSHLRPQDSLTFRVKVPKVVNESHRSWPSAVRIRHPCVQVHRQITGAYTIVADLINLLSLEPVFFVPSA
jgi:hypothetical protein